MIFWHNNRRLADHFMGKQHIGYQVMRDFLEAVKKRDSDRRRVYLITSFVLLNYCIIDLFYFYYLGLFLSALTLKGLLVELLLETERRNVGTGVGIDCV